MAKHRAATNALLSFYLVRGDQGFALPGMGEASDPSSSAAATPAPGVQLPTSVHADWVLPLSWGEGGIRRVLSDSASDSAEDGSGGGVGLMGGEGMLAAWGKEGNQDNSTSRGGRMRKVEQAQAERFNA